MIDLYTYNTFNGYQISIALEELGLEYTIHKVDLSMGEHNAAAFRLINPSGRIPVIVDHDVESDDLFTLTQTGAILIYLAEKCGKLIPKDVIERARVFEWMAFQSTDITASLFNAFFLFSMVKDSQVNAAALLRERAVSFYEYFDKRLEDSTYLSGEEYSIADIAVYPVVNTVIENPMMSEYKNIGRWLKHLGKRPSVIKGMSVPE
jgi:GST-like protein